MLTNNETSKDQSCSPQVILTNIDFFKYDYQNCVLSLIATISQAIEEQVQSLAPRQQPQQLQKPQQIQQQSDLQPPQQQLQQQLPQQAQAKPLPLQPLQPLQPWQRALDQDFSQFVSKTVGRALDQAIAQTLAKQLNCNRTKTTRSTKGRKRSLKNLSLQDLAEGKKAPQVLPMDYHTEVMLPIGRHLDQLNKLDVANEPLSEQVIEDIPLQKIEAIGRKLFNSLDTEHESGTALASVKPLGPTQACDLIITDAYAQAKAQEQMDLLGHYLSSYPNASANAQGFASSKDSHGDELNLILKLDNSRQQLSVFLDTEPNYCPDPALDLWSKKFPLTINYKDVYMKCLNSPHHLPDSSQSHSLALSEGQDYGSEKSQSYCQGYGPNQGQSQGQGLAKNKNKGRTANQEANFRKSKKERKLNSSNSSHIPFALNSTQKRNIELSAFKGSISTTAILFISLGFAFLSLAAFISRSMDTTVVPYVVTVDTHGVVRAQGTIDEKTDYMKGIPEQVISSQLCNFINDMRMVTPDKNMQKKALSHVFSCLKRDSKVFNQLQSTFEKSNPLDPQDKQEVQVEIANVIPLDHYTYQIDWLEKRTNSDDLYSQNQKMRALVSYEISAGYYQDPNLLMLNPLNLFIKELVVSPIIA